MPPSDPRGFDVAWSALAGLASGEGWRTTDLGVVGNTRLRAARRVPDDREAVMFGVPEAPLPHRSRLPSGRGFLVEILPAAADRRTWIALSRRHGASLPLFRTMADDLVEMLGTGRGTTVALLLDRIRAWQDFMSRGSDGMLDPEEEAGLFGELHVLGSLLDRVGDPTGILEGWTGPAGGLHDFRLGTGAIEVKSTLSPSGFIARVGSLEQLDPAVRSPLHVAAVRLVADAQGCTLPGRIAQLRTLLEAASPLAVHPFDLRLLQAGYLAAMSAGYVRRLIVTDMRLLVVDGLFPSLTRRNVPGAVVSMSYAVDLDVAGPSLATLAEFLAAARYGTRR